MQKIGLPLWCLAGPHEALPGCSQKWSWLDQQAARGRKPKAAEELCQEASGPGTHGTSRPRVMPRRINFPLAARRELHSTQRAHCRALDRVPGAHGTAFFATGAAPTLTRVGSRGSPRRTGRARGAALSPGGKARPSSPALFGRRRAPQVQFNSGLKRLSPVTSSAAPHTWSFIWSKHGAGTAGPTVVPVAR